MEKLYLKTSQRGEMLEHILQVLPEEACGILGGNAERVGAVLPVTNQLHSGSRYYMDPVELVHVFHVLDDHNLEILAIFHSHPNGPDVPSISDISEFNYPGTVEIIWFPYKNSWEMKGFIIEDQSYREIPIILYPET